MYGCCLMFYGISLLVGYLMLNLVFKRIVCMNLYFLNEELFCAQSNGFKYSYQTQMIALNIFDFLHTIK